MTYRRLAVAIFMGFVLAAPAVAADNVCDAGEAPDLIIGDIQDKRRWGVVGDVTSFSFGNHTCNVGTCQANWIDSTSAHPLFAQGLFRLKEGRFEQIGQSWIKHGFSALQLTLCGTCLTGTSSALGVNCSDPYSAPLNGTQYYLGPKFEVNPVTAVFPYPPTNGSTTGNEIYKRLQVKTSDLDPAANPGSQYFVELHVLARDDSQGGNQHNNASYRRVTVSGSAGAFDLFLADTTQRTKTAVEAWNAVDPAVDVENAFDGENGRFVVAAKATPLGGTAWHYEYAVQNMNSYRAARSFRVPIPPAAAITNVGFHDVPYHSGEPFDGADWTATVGGDPPAVTWTTAEYGENPNANALRWGTVYNFRFDADVPPAADQAEIVLFRPGTPSSVVIATVAPGVCVANGVCGPGETCTNCAADCAGQGGGAGCCGNLTCEAGENPCLCTADCGVSTPTEVACANGIDDNCDGQTDCLDPDCCTNTACAGSDLDSDGYAGCDCDDGNPNVWSTPGEALDLLLSRGSGNEAVLGWLPPLVPGGASMHYTAIRAATPVDFTVAATCLYLPDPALPSGADAADPGPGAAFYYLVRASNACPSGVGSLGAGSDGVPRAGRLCP